MRDYDEQVVRELVESSRTCRAERRIPRQEAAKSVDGWATLVDLRIENRILRGEVEWERARSRDAGLMLLASWVVIVMGIAAKIGGMW